MSTYNFHKLDNNIYMAKTMVKLKQIALKFSEL